MRQITKYHLHAIAAKSLIKASSATSMEKSDMLVDRKERRYWLDKVNNSRGKQGQDKTVRDNEKGRK